MSERDKLICKLKALIAVNLTKQKQYQEQNNLSSDVGCITREGCEIASLFPRMQLLGVTFDDCK